MTHVTLPDLQRRYKRAQQFKRALKRRGITQDVLAAAAGVTRTMVTHWLAGRTVSQPLELKAKELLAGAKKNHAAA